MQANEEKLRQKEVAKKEKDEKMNVNAIYAKMVTRASISPFARSKSTINKPSSIIGPLALYNIMTSNPEDVVTVIDIINLDFQSIVAKFDAHKKWH